MSVTGLRQVPLSFPTLGAKEPVDMSDFLGSWRPGGSKAAPRGD